MQLQSYGGVIRVFPAWPKGWQSEFTLVAEGGFLVSSRIGESGEIPEIRIQSWLGKPCTVANPWPGEVNIGTPSGEHVVARMETITIETKPGDVYVLRPIAEVPDPASIPVARNEGPKWPFHQGASDTIESYMKRTDSFGMIGIAKDGQNLTRNRVQKALAEQARRKEQK
jgi:hypothetical protein